MTDTLRLVDRYRLVERLGAGAMGVVWSAIDERLARPVAVKVLVRAGLSDEAARRRLTREARAVAQLDHPNVVKVYDTDSTPKGDVFVVMELVRGKTLRALLNAGELSPRERLRVLVDVARGLAAAHAAGLVHRDVKPDNIMVRHDGRGVVLDFGLAKVLEEAQVAIRSTLTAPGVVVGTPEYAAPEQARGLEVTSRADQFGFGVVAFEVFTGRLPWRRAPRMQLLLEMVTHAPPRLTSLSPWLPAEIDDIVMRALAQDPKNRYRDMGQVADALEELLALVPADLVAYPPTVPRIAPTPRSSEETNVASWRVNAIPVERGSNPRSPRLVSQGTPSSSPNSSDDTDISSGRVVPIALRPADSAAKPVAAPLVLPPTRVAAPEPGPERGDGARRRRAKMTSTLRSANVPRESRWRRITRRHRNSLGFAASLVIGAALALLLHRLFAD
ncbi:MAG TPA: serine/threonine-protein kinase [Minicystis sp.]|nr:serine/threonine-protein kinase [Minicystis sp.]